MNNPESSSFDDLMAQGMAASEADEGERAIACFVRASASTPEAALPQFLLGAECAALGDMERAEAAFANATRLAPEFPMARYQLGLLQFSSGRAAIALLTWQPLMQLPQIDPLPHFVAGFAALAQDRFDDALGHFGLGLTFNASNQTLSNDIEKVMAGIHELTCVRAQAADAEDSHEDSAAHVLLAGYQQNGPAH